MQPYLASVVQTFPTKASEGAVMGILKVVLRYNLHIVNCKSKTMMKINGNSKMVLYRKKKNALLAFITGFKTLSTISWPIFSI